MSGPLGCVTSGPLLPAGGEINPQFEFVRERIFEECQAFLETDVLSTEIYYASRETALEALTRFNQG